MRELDFLLIWEREVWKKRIAYLISVLLFFILLWVLFLSTLRENKTQEDKVREYVTCRLNYTPMDVDRAYLSCPYGSKRFGLEQATAPERQEIAKSGLISFFYAEKIFYDPALKEWIIKGRRVLIDGQGNSKTENVTVEVIWDKGGFLVKDVRSGGY